MGTPNLHIAMCPWFALGHVTSFLHISNKLAQKGHKISFFIPTKTQSKVDHFNIFPHQISFVPIAVPHVDGLPPGAETTNDVPTPLIPLLMVATDRMESDFEMLLNDLKPDIVFYDSAYWMAKLARRLGIKSVHYSTVSAVAIGYNLPPDMKLSQVKKTVAEEMQPPPGFPDSSIKLRLHEAREKNRFRSIPFGINTYFSDRICFSFMECDAIAFKTCREIEGPIVDYIERQTAKPVLLAGPVLPERPLFVLEEKWTNWLGRFKPRSVVYCAFGSEATKLRKDQFQELLLGLELSGLPFLAALRPPLGGEKIEEALPEGFEERLGGRGVVHDEWIQQQLILEHKSVGCFVTHCGWGSLFEGLLNSACELVMIPQIGDQMLNARLMADSLKVGVEVAKGEEDGLFTRESVCNAIRTVMEENYSELGAEIRANRAELRESLLNKDVEYIDEFSRKLQALLH